MTTLKQIYEQAEQKAADAHNTAVHMCNERAWRIAKKAAETAEQAFQAWMEFDLKIGDHIKTPANGGWFYGQVTSHAIVTPPATLEGRKPPFDRWTIEAREFVAGRQYVDCTPGKKVVR